MALLQRLEAFKNRHPPVVPILIHCSYLLVLFLGILSYFYGSLFQVNTRIHNLNIFTVDYDGGIIGQALQSAYHHLENSDFPTLNFVSANTVALSNIAKQRLCNQDYWAVLYTHPGASERLISALAGNGTSTYDPTETITYILDGINYPVIAEAYITANLQALFATTSHILQSTNFPQILSSRPDQNQTLPFTTLFIPLSPQLIDLHPANQGPRVLLNTITIVAPPLLQFFYLMAQDHIFLATKTFLKTRTPSGLYLTRLLSSKLFTFIAGLIPTIVIYAFREDWDITGGQVAQTWMVFWFYSDISYLIMDTVIGGVIEMRYAPFFVFGWVVLSVTSTLFPFELNPGLYRWGWALPSHDIWLILVRVWSGGCGGRLDVTLPVLMVWWLGGHVGSWWAVGKKCRGAGWTETNKEDGA